MTAINALKRNSAYSPALDGLRALALLVVILYHLGYCPWGWFGVPTFFILSGHFITQTLLKHPELTRGRRARNFARNRILRLAPLYVAFCVVLTVLAIADYGDGSTMRNLPYLWTWSLDLSTMAHDFQPTQMQLFTHLWTLGVEAQVYILWGLLAILLPRQWFVRTLVVLALTGPLLRAGLWFYLTESGYPTMMRPIIVYTSPLTYLEAFAVGGLTALPELREPLRKAARWMVAVFAAATAALVLRALSEGRGLVGDLGYPVFLPDHYAWVWKYTLVTLFFGAVVLILDEHAWSGVRLFEWSPLVRIGVISYGIYVSHIPLLGQIQRWRGGEDQPWTAGGALVTVLLFAMAVTFAELSYRFLEQPFLRLKRGGLLQSSEEPARPATADPVDPVRS
ncbi:acyltransferase family protein [Streptomyces sp. NBC_00343]|uniref:acyltransferase family protein n=1 Tax=Streptomyces sp. NBC_00343 TaxID=2975719 RepID=UPI002E28B655|nr:acyltransferase [Streptomyces sp. NBC_00343]